MAQFSVRDLYPNMTAFMSTAEITAPELDEQVVLTKGADGAFPEMVTRQDRTSIIWSLLVVVALLFIFGLVE